MRQKLDRIGWTVGHFAEVIGVSKRTIYNWMGKSADSNGARVANAYLDLMCHVMGV